VRRRELRIAMLKERYKFSMIFGFLQIFFIFCSLAFFCGCSSIRPYTSPPKDASMMERQELYSEHSVTYSWVNHIMVGGGSPGSSFDFYSKFGNYYDASGDTYSANSVKRFEPGNWAAWTFLLGALAVDLVALTESSNNSSASENAIYIWYAAMGAALNLDAWGHWKYLLPASLSFNRYLKRDLGISNNSATDTPSNITDTTKTSYSGGFLLKNKVRITRDGNYLFVGFTYRANSPDLNSIGTTPTATVEIYDKKADKNLHLSCDQISLKKSHLDISVSNAGIENIASIELEGNFLNDFVTARAGVDLDYNYVFDFEGRLNGTTYEGEAQRERNKLKFVCVN
jgi:hypothetical protein